MLRIAGSPDELRAALAERRRALSLSQLDADDLAGLQNGYTGKIEAAIREPKLTILFLLLEALGLKLALVPADAQVSFALSLAVPDTRPAPRVPGRKRGITVREAKRMG